MDILPVPVLATNYAYLIIKGSDCFVVDPGSAREVLEVIADRGLVLLGVLLTHHHHDHIGGVVDLLGGRDVLAYGGEDDSFPFPVKQVGHGQEIPLFEGVVAQCLHLPGHTMGAMAFLVGKALFTGDVLFGGGCGRIFEGTAEDMLGSMDRILGLSDDVLIYCGHEYTRDNLRFAAHVEPDNEAIEKRLKASDTMDRTVPSTLQMEKQTNPFLRIDLDPVIGAVNRYVGRDVGSRVERFGMLREWKNDFDVG